MIDALQVPDFTHRAELNATLFATGADSGFWDDHGHPAPWPDDIHEWRPSTSEPISIDPGQQPF